MILSFTCMSVYDSFILKPETLKKRSCLHLHHWYICLVIVSSCLHCFVFLCFFWGGGCFVLFLFLCFFFLIDKWTQNTTEVQNYHTPCSWLWHLLIHVYIWFKPSTQGLSIGAVLIPNGQGGRKTMLLTRISLIKIIRPRCFYDILHIAFVFLKADK